MNHSIVKAERVDFQIAPGYLLEFYRLPSGEKRIGVTSASAICGHRKEFLSRLPTHAPKQWESLRSLGFDGCPVQCKVERLSKGGKGSAVAQTISLEDFRAFIEFSAFDLNKKPAKAIARALLGVSIETIARQAFGEEALTLEEIRRIVCREYAKTIDWVREDKEDWAVIDAHQIFLAA